MDTKFTFMIFHLQEQPRIGEKSVGAEKALFRVLLN
jgi:hypothetical protein